MSEFKREDRYIVVKLKHLAGLQRAPLRNFLRENHVPQIECVVVEHDWPEYNLVRAMIEHRMAGKPVPDFNLWRRANELQELLNQRDEQLNSLEQRRYAEQQAREAAEKDAERYRWLRGRDFETIQQGGVFAGVTPENMVINGVDLDNAIDAAIEAALNLASEAESQSPAPGYAPSPQQ